MTLSIIGRTYALRATGMFYKVIDNFLKSALCRLFKKKLSAFLEHHRAMFCIVLDDLARVSPHKMSNCVSLDWLRYFWEVVLIS
jgi:hypothetical protein